MPYTNDPENVPADQVRFLLGDTSTSPDLSDNEIAFLLSEAGDNILRAAARGAEFASARFATAVEERRVGPLTIKSAISKARKYGDLARALWLRALAIGDAKPFAGGISVLDKAMRAADTDRTPSSYRRDMMLYPGQPLEGSRDERLS